MSEFVFGTHNCYSIGWILLLIDSWSISVFPFFYFLSTFKQGCEMHIRFGVSDDGSQLVVKSMSELHNHEINEVGESYYRDMI